MKERRGKGGMGWAGGVKRRGRGAKEDWRMEEKEQTRRGRERLGEQREEKEKGKEKGGEKMGAIDIYQIHLTLHNTDCLPNIMLKLRNTELKKVVDLQFLLRST